MAIYLFGENVRNFEGRKMNGPWRTLCLVFGTLALARAQYDWTFGGEETFSLSTRLDGHILKEFDYTYVVTQCAKLCALKDCCVSYNFNEDSHICQLNSETLATAPDDAQPDIEWTTFTASAYTYNIELGLGICTTYPCQNGGVCVNTDNAHECVCQSGFAGKNCEDVDVPNQWGDWSEYSECSVSCELGYQTRTRNCVTPRGEVTDPGNCEGDATEEQKCNPQDCPRWSEWSEFQTCDAAKTCGQGVMTRGRQCPGGTPGVDALCMGPTKETKPCTGLQCDAPIRLENGEVFGEGRVVVYDSLESSWGGVCVDHWDLDDATIVCKALGFPKGAFRAYVDTRFGEGSRLLSLSGTSCSGSEASLFECIHDAEPTCTSTTNSGLSCIVDGSWGNWSPWADCSVTCELGTTTRTRECNHPPPAGGGSECEGSPLETKECELEPCPVDGDWEPWSDWGECNTTCGGGMQERTRTCQPPENGGDPCSGKFTDHRPCNEQSCAINGNWALWTDWSLCSVSCGDGTRTRQRSCTNPKPQFGGEFCSGPANETEECKTKECAIDGAWAEWAQWSDCSEECGPGTRTRERSCTNPPPQYGGKECEGDGSQTENCQIVPCPVDGQWAAWSAWDNCTHACGNGTQMRRRECTNPAPEYGGKDCVGDAEDTQACFIKHCPVDGNWATWEEWGECSVTCGDGTQKRERTCTSPPPQYGGLDCEGTKTESKMCMPLNCPVDGVWREWSDWSPCTVTCGGGTKYRDRTCDGPYYNGEECPGPDGDTEDCNTFPCPIDGSWAQWSSWADCSTTCGNGTWTRQRTCDDPPPQHGGEPCQGQSDDIEDCKLRECPVDGKWQEWSDWDTCTVTCGGGQQSRTRECTAPIHGGQDCPGNATDTQFCGDMPCPVDGAWSLWTRWMECNATCGGGLQRRYRTCSEAEHGGADCEGEGNEYRVCGEKPCPIDGAWSSWEPWGVCSQTCGDGIKKRYRTCTNPAPEHGGEPCPGSNVEDADCFEVHCPIDGGYTPYGEWQACSHTCGNGTKIRTRHCTEPEPQYGGKDCEGPPIDTAQCFLKHCPIDGNWAPWNEWGTCSTTCGNGTQIRGRTCSDPQPQYEGEDCIGEGSESRQCFLRHCPVHGVWSVWSAWDVCSKSCGHGTQRRTRNCTDPAPLYGGDDCSGPSYENEGCFLLNCPVDGNWAAWSSWQDCTTTCGNGTKTRTRSCTNPNPQYGGKACTGSDVQTEYCHLRHCPVNGNWSQWSAWGDCSTTCSNGTKKRMRTCTNPAPAYDGLDCQGNLLEFSSCFVRHCPVDGVWQEWSEWGHCSATCGDGKRSRNRTCTEPLHGGLDCPGDAIEEEICAPNPCPIPGEWGPWGDWATCSVTCGGGVRTRYRECNMTSYAELTAPCIGSHVDTDNNCHKFHCTPMAASCAAWVDRGLTFSGVVQIAPYGDNLFFPVYCDVATKTTIVHHNREEETEVTGFEGPGEYNGEVQYVNGYGNATLDIEGELGHLVDVSEHCEQYIMWECLSAAMFPYGYDESDASFVRATYWVNRIGDTMNYWGGADPNTNSCACGMDGSCNPPSLRCNCDANDYSWHKDEGKLTWKSDLPVRGIRAGETGEKHKEIGRYILGPLYCYGNNYE